MLFSGCLGWMNPFGGMIRINKMDSLAGTNGKKMERKKLWSVRYLYLTMWLYKLKINGQIFPDELLKHLPCRLTGMVLLVQKLLKISSRMELDAFLKESNAYDYTEKDLQQNIENIRKSLLK